MSLRVKHGGKCSQQTTFIFDNYDRSYCHHNSNVCFSYLEGLACDFTTWQMLSYAAASVQRGDNPPAPYGNFAASKPVDDRHVHVNIYREIRGAHHRSKTPKSEGRTHSIPFPFREGICKKRELPQLPFNNARLVFVVVVPRGRVNPNEFQNVKICISIW